MRKCPVCSSMKYKNGYCKKCGFINNKNQLENMGRNYKTKPIQSIVSGPTRNSKTFVPEPGMTYHPQINKGGKKMTDEGTQTAESEETIEPSAEEAKEEVAAEETKDEEKSEDTEDSE